MDTVCSLKSIKKIDKSNILDFKISNLFKKQLVEKASILINGVSLTISKIKKNSFEIWVIPHTLKLTNLINLKKKALDRMTTLLVSRNPGLKVFFSKNKEYGGSFVEG